MAWFAINGRVPESPRLQVIQRESFDIALGRSMAKIAVDGELLETPSPLEVRVRGGALKVVLPE
jgi:diacylglycerol kinase family enzyme